MSETPNNQQYQQMQSSQVPTASSSSAAQAGAGPSTPQTHTAPLAAAATTPGALGQSTDVATVIGQIMKQQLGERYSVESIANLLKQNMDHFARQGKLNPAQIAQVRPYVYMGLSLRD